MARVVHVAGMRVFGCLVGWMACSILHVVRHSMPGVSAVCSLLHRMGFPIFAGVMAVMLRMFVFRISHTYSFWPSIIVI
jgi:hypothetical protein